MEATNNKEVEAFYPIIFANYLGDKTKLAQLIAFPSAGGGGGGGGGGDAAEEEEEEKVEEEEEADIGGGMDMFGGDGDGGDY